MRLVCALHMQCCMDCHGEKEEGEEHDEEVEEKGRRSEERNEGGKHRRD